MGAAAKISIIGAALLYSANASAFCRTTTCDVTTQKCTLNSEGCVRDGLAVVWQISPIPYRFYAKGSKKLDDDNMRKAVRAAFDTWSSVDCASGPTSLKFEEGDDIAKDKPTGRTVIELEDQHFPSFGIFFRDKTWDHDDKSVDSLALTSVGFATNAEGTAHLTYADMEVNTAENDFHFESTQAAKDYDFQTVITHEVGHYFGLAHSSNPDSIMAPVYCQSTTDRCASGVAGKRALSADDKAAVCAYYPPRRDGLAAGDATTAGCTTSQRSTREPLWGLVPMIAIAARRLFRRRARMD